MRWLLLIFILFFATGCSREEEEEANGVSLDEFIPQYNAYIREWIAKELVKAEKKKDQAMVERLKGRQLLGDYFSFKNLDELPEDLPWKDGLDQPEQGDPAAKKGGTWTYMMSSFPPTLRRAGPREANGFRSSLYGRVSLSLVELHRVNGSMIPGVAREWAPGPDGKTWYFRLHEDAAYSDGVPIKAKDYMMMVFIYVSNNVTSPYYKQYFREEFAQWAVYDDHTLSVTFPKVVSELGMFNLVSTYDPAPPHFYKDYGPDFEQRYQWKPAPTSGPYFVKPEDVVKGESITLTRNKNWWAKDKKYFRYLYNPDRLVWRVVRDRSKAFELFRAGELDIFTLTDSEEWYGKSEIPPVFDGYIERHWWYNQFPRPPWGIYLNTSIPLLKDRDTRLGIAHAMNWDKVIGVVFWGDISRLSGLVEGYGDWVNKEVKPRGYSPQKAREYFAKSGYTEEGEDGILRRADGKRLEVILTLRNNKPIYAKMGAILKNSARAAGIDVILNNLDPHVGYKRLMKKQHEMAISAWVATPPFFAYYEFLHSKNAYDEKGNLKHNTNNVFTYANPEADRLCELYRSTPDIELKKETGLKLQQIIHDDGIFIPGWNQNFERIGSWRWVRWPDCEDVKFTPPIHSRPWDGYAFWIDEDMKKETLEAMRKGETFPEVENIVEDYRE